MSAKPTSQAVSGPSTAVPTKLCSTCAEEIRAEARKCIKCGSYQDFRRFVAGGGALVSVLGAMISIFIALGPQIGSLLTPRYAKPEIALAGAAANVVTLRVHNRGLEPIFVFGAALEFGKGRSSNWRNLQMLQREVTGAPVEGKSTRNFLFVIDGGIGPFTTRDSVCSFSVFYTGRSGEREVVDYRASCPALAGLGDELH